MCPAPNFSTDSIFSFILKLRSALKVQLSSFGIEDLKVKTVNFYNDDLIEFVIYDHLVKKLDGSNTPCIQVLRAIKNNNSVGNVTITHISPTNDILYSETYKDVKIKEIMRSSFDYKLDELATISVLFDCSKHHVTYEATDKKQN